MKADLRQRPGNVLISMLPASPAGGGGGRKGGVPRALAVLSFFRRHRCLAVTMPAAGPIAWSTQDVQEWLLNDLELPQSVAEAFKTNAIDGR